MKKILVVADKSGDKHLALDRALTLLDDQGGSIVVVGFCYLNIDDDLDSGLSEKQLQKLIMQQRQQELEQVVAEKRRGNVKISIRIIWEKNIARWITQHVNEIAYDCVLKSGNRSESWLHTPTDWQLFHECPIPVFVVAGKSWKKKSRVLVALDMASKKPAKQRLNKKLLFEAKALSQVLHAELHIVCALEIPRVLSDLDLVDARKLIKKRRAQIEPRLEALCDEYAIASDHVHIKQGEPHRVVPSTANKIKADVVVAGTASRKGVKKLVGRTAEAILTRLYTDIYVVKP